MDALRRLDFDDLLLIQRLGQGETLSQIAKSLHISQPALSQRLRKIEDVFAFALVVPDGRRLQLTEDGLALALSAGGALQLMQNAQGGESKAVINIGTRTEVGFSWLGPALLDLRSSYPGLRFHLHVAAGHEIIQRLGTGGLDAILTSAPITVREFRSLELCEEKYVFAARKDKAERLKKAEHFTDEVLIEFDRSFPFLRYLEAEARAQLSFGDVWFLGSTVLMAEAIKAGHGVGIVPEYLIRKELKSGSVKALTWTRKVGTDSFRLIHRNDPRLEQYLRPLAQRLKARGLS